MPPVRINAAVTEPVAPMTSVPASKTGWVEIAASEFVRTLARGLMLLKTTMMRIIMPNVATKARAIARRESVIVILGTLDRDAAVKRARTTVQDMARVSSSKS